MIFGLLFLLLILFIYFNQYRRRRSNESIPFVKEGYFPWIGHLLIFMYDRTNYLKKFEKIYGSIFQMKVFEQKFVFVTNPSDWSILIRNHSLTFLGDLFSKRIFNMDHNFFGKSHLDIQLQKYFHLLSIQSNQFNKQILQHILQYFHQEKSNLKDNQWINGNLFELSFNLLFNSITKTFYGNIQLESIKDHYRNFDFNIQYLFLLLPQWISHLIFGNVFKSRDQLNQYWLNHIHLENESQLVENRTNLMINNAEYFSQNDYSGEKTFLLWSSLSNTIPTLFWSLCHLFNDPNALKVIQDEIKQNFSNDNQIDLSKIRSLKYLDSLINETLRMYSNPMIMRRASKDLQLKFHDGKEISIEKNDIIALYPYLAQNDHKYYPNADQFQFHRFINEKVENMHGFLPFGSGQSMCPGRIFAKNVIQISIIVLLQSIDINFDHPINVPHVNQQRQGIGVSHPQNDVTFLFRFK